MVELNRIKHEYARRDAHAETTARYAGLNQANQFAVHSRDRAVLALLNRLGLRTLADCRLLDAGCGAGSNLLIWLTRGILPEHCAGIDLIAHRIEHARTVLPVAVDLRCADASSLPYEDARFDIVTQYMLMSSVLDANLRVAIARELMRVLKPGGVLIWYDFWVNPRNRETRGIRLPEIARLFPGCRIDARLTTLAPPLARLFVPRAQTVAMLLELLPLKTHWVAGITKPRGGD